MKKQLPEKLQDKWDEAARTGQPVDMEGIVVCDICDEDYTDSPETGGFIFGSTAYCPKCADKGMKSIKQYNEEHYIKAVCPEGKSFGDFVREYRGDRDYIWIHK